MKLTFATRPSALARWQTQWVIHALQNIHPNLECDEKVITTQGDKNLDKPLPEIGGKGLFTQELESELLNGDVHCAVHSLKDLPVENPAGLTVGCIPARAEVRDALISRDGYTLATLPNGVSVGTSSLRRAAQILSLRPDIKTESLRGNVDTRLRKALDGQYDAIILAGAGLTRLGLDSHVTEWLSLDAMLPAPGQGALAIQCRADDQTTLDLLASLEDDSTRKCVTAERAFLQGLGGGCAVPVAAYAEVNSHQSSLISLTGLVISEAGRKAVKVTGQGTAPIHLGSELAQKAIQQGADEILKLITVR
ncbi:MAG: hydroxymethylbilane synthase [Anaerolineae bacterium CG_4_9_14_3_um_filter_57_17]|nr:MAG: hydroxymethylbilane synthase [Anaerolineae bacterium CG_4_9_14_3_um_filter_57_17]